MYVLDGRLRLLLGADDLTIEPGEAVEFTTTTPHWFGAHDGPVTLIGTSARQASGLISTREPRPWSYVDAVSDATLGRRFKRWFWRPPRPHGETIADRTVSFLELFYDLVYVVVISQAAHHLTEHVTRAASPTSPSSSA